MDVDSRLHFEGLEPDSEDECLSPPVVSQSSYLKKQMFDVYSDSGIGSVSIDADDTMAYGREPLPGPSLTKKVHSPST